MYKNGNYCAFYVTEPFNESNLGACATKDFCYYQMLKAWKGADSSFPFVNSHDKTYDVRDGSDWEKTLKPRLHERLSNSKNVIFFLSSVTRNSCALHEEIRYAIEELGLPIIVVYPELKELTYKNNGKTYFTKEVVDLWSKIPFFRDNMNKVPTLHITMTKDEMRKALESSSYKVQTKAEAGKYIL